MRFKVLWLAGLMLAVAAGMSSVEAGVIYTFQYVDSASNTLSGKLDGDLQGDNNTVIVSSVSDLTFNTVSVGSFPYLNSATTVVYEATFVAPTVSLNGIIMDLFVTNGPPGPGVDGFVFAPPGLAGPGSPTVYEATFASLSEPFNSLNWTLTSTASAAVPEPSSIALLGFGAVGLFARARRRRRQAKLSV